MGLPNPVTPAPLMKFGVGSVQRAQQERDLQQRALSASRVHHDELMRIEEELMPASEDTILEAQRILAQKEMAHLTASETYEKSSAQAKAARDALEPALSFNHYHDRARTQEYARRGVVDGADGTFKSSDRVVIYDIAKTNKNHSYNGRRALHPRKVSAREAAAAGDG